MGLCERWLLWGILTVAPCVCVANDYVALYKAAGWPVQVEHFDVALKSVQEQYKPIIPAFFYQAIVSAVNQQFVVSEINQRAEEALKQNLTEPAGALKFFNSDLGIKVVHSETQATTKEELLKNQEGVPVLSVTESRRALFKQLSAAIPYQQAAVEVSLALTDSTIDMVEQLFPNMGIGAQLKPFTPTKQQIMQQINGHLENTLIYVYRNLSDGELQRFVSFAESSEGKAYYQAAKVVVYDGLNKK